MIRVCVTGGAGFIGTPLVKKLLKRNCNVLTIDDFSVGNREAFQGETIEKLSITLRSELRNLIVNFMPDVIIHLAAIHHIPTCEKNRIEAQQVNIVGTENLLGILPEIQATRFVLASSGAVYDWHDGPLVEDEHTTNCFDNYSLCKLTNEKQVKLWDNKVDTKFSICRIFNTIGTNDKNAHLIPDIMDQLKTNKNTVSLGNIHTKRDYIHVEDTSSAIAEVALDKSQKKMNVFNIGSASDYSVEDIVLTISYLMNKDITIEISQDKVRKVDRPTQLSSIKKIQSEFGWKPRYSIRDAVMDILDEK